MSITPLQLAAYLTVKEPQGFLLGHFARMLGVTEAEAEGLLAELVEQGEVRKARVGAQTRWIARATSPEHHQCLTIEILCALGGTSVEVLRRVEAERKLTAWLSLPKRGLPTLTPHDEALWQTTIAHSGRVIEALEALIATLKSLGDQGGDA